MQKGNGGFRAGAAGAVALVMAVAGSAPASADSAQARELFKAMSDHLAAQQAIAFDFDSTLEIVTTDDQKIGLASSGRVALRRPDRLHAMRVGGFSDAEMAFDGETFTVYGRAAGNYAEIAAPGTVDALFDMLRETLGMPLAAADFLMSNPEAELMPLVTDAKDLGSGVIGGVECDHLAFRSEDVDWQIWITQGDAPRPCRFTVTTHGITGWPTYSIDVRNWSTDADVTDDFEIAIAADAIRVEPGALSGIDEIGGIFETSAGE